LVDVLIAPSLREQHRRELERDLATGEADLLGKRVEMTAIRADGSEFPAELAIARILADGPPSFTAFLRDITERKRSEEELRRSEAFLAQGQRLSLTGSFSWLLDADELTFSEEFYRIFEFEPGTPVTIERIGTRIHPEDIPLFNEKIQSARNGHNDLEYEIRLRMPVGSLKYIRTNAQLIRDRDGRMECIGVLQDVTQRRLSEEALNKARSELAQVSRMTSLGALTASIAHEITQPLAAIVTNADSCLQWLAKQQPNLERARKAAERIVDNGHRAGNIIESVRALARSSSSQMVMLEINRLIRDTLELVHLELQRHNVSLETRFLDTQRFVRGNPTQLQQVIVNLVMNGLEAISATTGSTRILRVIADLDQDGVLTMVEDSGSGIDPGIVDRIFEPMTTTKPGGMGLGLSICRSIVEGHGGRLWASPNPTGGSIFRFSIPEAADMDSIAGSA
jgi:C4-dicarboxylate-specific signal transduction histidine kinase